MPNDTPPDDGRMTIVEHLTELRRRLIISLIAVAAGAVIAFVLFPQILHLLAGPYRKVTDQEDLIVTGVLDAFAARLKVATYGGLMLASPVVLWQTWRFITPGLYPKEKRYAIPFVASSIVLFLMGAVIALVTFPKALQFLLGIGGHDIHPTIRADSYLTLIFLMILAFGASFEFPLVLVFLLLARVINTRQLARWRRGMAVGITAFAAVITPSQDPFSLFAMAIPMYLFYEAAIIVGKVLKR